MDRLRVVDGEALRKYAARGAEIHIVSLQRQIRVIEKMFPGATKGAKLLELRQRAAYARAQKRA